MSEEEYTGKSPIIVRRRIPHSHSVSSIANIDWGQPTNERTIFELARLAREKIGEYFAERGSELKNLDEQSLGSIADFANRNFPFENQGTGVGTIPKLLENYRTTPLEKLPGKLDCKLATVMTGLIIQEVAKRINVQVELNLGSKDLAQTNITAHPTLLVDIGGDKEKEEIYVVDFHNDLESGKSKFTVRPLTKGGLTALKSGRITTIPFNIEGLSKLDQVFLRD